MNETTNFTGYSQGLGLTGTSTTITTNSSGITLSGNSTINYSNNLGSLAALTPTNHMTPKQVNVAVFTITRNSKTNEINGTKFVKQLWVEQKNGTSIDLLVAKELGNDFDPESTIIKVLSTVGF